MLRLDVLTGPVVSSGLVDEPPPKLSARMIYEKLLHLSRYLDGYKTEMLCLHDDKAIESSSAELAQVWTRRS